MSNTLLTAVRELQMSPAAKTVLKELADSAGEPWDKEHPCECWMKLETLVRWTCCSLSKVKRGLKELRESGLIESWSSGRELHFRLKVIPQGVHSERPDSSQRATEASGSLQKPSESQEPAHCELPAATVSQLSSKRFGEGERRAEPPVIDPDEAARMTRVRTRRSWEPALSRFRDPYPGERAAAYEAAMDAHLERFQGLEPGALINRRRPAHAPLRRAAGGHVTQSSTEDFVELQEAPEAPFLARARQRLHQVCEQLLLELVQAPQAGGAPS